MNERDETLEGRQVAVAAIKRHGCHQYLAFAKRPFHKPGGSGFQFATDADPVGGGIQSQFPVAGDKSKRGVRLVWLCNQLHCRMGKRLEFQFQRISRVEAFIESGGEQGFPGRGLPVVVKRRFGAGTRGDEQSPARLDESRHTFGLGRG